MGEVHAPLSRLLDPLSALEETPQELPPSNLLTNPLENHLLKPKVFVDKSVSKHVSPLNLKEVRIFWQTFSPKEIGPAVCIVGHVLT